jgi:hypothetical protein
MKIRKMLVVLGLAVGGLVSGISLATPSMSREAEIDYLTRLWPFICPGSNPYGHRVCKSIERQLGELGVRTASE